jgi:diguanylate cyclase (GGDEF)-like protein
MISLLKHIEEDREQLLRAALESNRSTLSAVIEFGRKASPEAGEGLNEHLAKMQAQLDGSVTLARIAETERSFRQELEHWGDVASGYFQRKTQEIKDIMKLVANTARALSEQDERYAGQFTRISTSLQAVADLDDLTEIRKALLKNNAELRTCVQKMSEDSQISIEKLRADLADYRTRLEETEQLASVDQLTGLANRRRAEQRLDFLVREASPFCVIIFDLNNFKSVNDTYGHLAGDRLLKQFAVELQSRFRATEMVGRWGGDEFIVILDCTLSQARGRMQTIREWVFGDYVVESDGHRLKVPITAAIGVAEWQPGESGMDILRRADAEMYDQKTIMHRGEMPT